MGRGWNVAVGLVSDTTWVTPQAWRIVSRGSSTHGVPIGSGFSALIFFGSFLYQDKKERENHSLRCFSFAMQSFSVALWKMYYVHRYTCGNNHSVTNITPLRGWKRCSLLVKLLSCWALAKHLITPNVAANFASSIRHILVGLNCSLSL